MSPYYAGGGITLFHGDCRKVLPTLELANVVLVTDPPFGIALSSNWNGGLGDLSIANDGDTSARDWVLTWAKGRPALVFGSWRVPRPPGARALLTWNKGGQCGMGNLAIPWKPNTEEIYVLGDGFHGSRTTSVLSFDAPAASAGCGRLHPTEKPVALMAALLAKCPPGVVVDPFAGSGSTLLAARKLARRAVGVEIEERYCEVIAKRLEAHERQGDLFPVTEGTT